MPYRFVQYIYYAPYTYTVSPIPKLVGSTYNVEDDLNKRVFHLLSVLDYAMRKVPTPSGTTSSEVLRIFAAPEFALRSGVGTQDGSDHYGLTALTSMRNYMRDRIFDTKMLDDWLIVPGTAVYTRSDLSGAPPQTIFNEVWAFAPTLSRRTAVETYCQKVNFAKDDALTRSGDPVRIVAPARHNQFITVDGCTTGFEICLDHQFKCLQTAAVAQGRTVDVHLLVAAGQPIRPESVAARLNGYVLRCDGVQPVPRGEAKQVTGWPNGAPRNGDTATLSGTLGLTDVQLPPDLDDFYGNRGAYLGYSGALSLN